MSKIKGEIENITLSSVASYVNSSFAPTLINYIHGKNGSGKTTISREIATNPGALTFGNGKAYEDYTILCFNADFIRTHFSDYQNIPGVFVVGEENVELIEQHDEAVEQYQAQQIITKTKRDEGVAKKGEIDTLVNNFMLTSNTKIKTLKEKFKVALTGKLKGNVLIEELLASTLTPTEHNVDDLEKACNLAYDKSVKKVPLFKNIDEIPVPTCDLFNQEIVSTGSSPFAKNVKDWNVGDWLRTGHEMHVENDHLCPYCQQPLPSNFEDEYNSCFDDEYQAKIKTLLDFRDAYFKFMSTIMNLLKANENSLGDYDKIDLTGYLYTIGMLDREFKTNALKIKQKLTNPTEKIDDFIDVSTTLFHLKAVIDATNRDINANNDVVDNKATSRTNCYNNVIEYLKFVLKDDIEVFNTTKSGLDGEIETLRSEYSESFRLENEYKNKVSELKEQIANIQTVSDSINSLLKDAGFNNFSILENSSLPGTYIIQRNGETSPAQNLSEGEKNFIAFLYFYHLIKGSINKDEVDKPKIVVIDDPVSSMDSDSMFLVSSIVRELIEITHNNVDLESEGDDYIKQIFILTHNGFFHNSVTNDYADDFDNVSFFKIRKINNISSVIGPLTKPNPKRPSESINDNPVQNTYKSLWTQLADAPTINTTVSSIRQILEYYFIEISGYKTKELERRIIVDNKDKFVTIKDDGTEDTSKLIIARSLINRITSSTRNEDMFFFEEDDQAAIDRYKDILRLIFEAMGQPQHYDHMTSIA